MRFTGVTLLHSAQVGRAVPACSVGTARNNNNNKAQKFSLGD